MKFSRILTAFVLIAIACVSFRLPSPVYAQQIDLTVTPPTLEVLIKPDMQALLPYTVINRGDSVGLRPLIRTFSISKQREYVEYGSVEKVPIKLSFIDENSETIDAFVLAKGSSKKIFLLLDVPSAAAEGDYSLSFMVETQPELLDKQYSARIKSQVASPLLITITKTGKTQIKGAISIFEIAGSLFDSFDPIPVTLRLKNEGKNSLNAGGAVTVRGSFGESATYPLQNQNVLSNSEKLMTTKRAEGDRTAILKGFFIGRYGVSASVVLADGTVQLNRSTRFFAFPFKIVLFGVLTSFVGIMLLRKRR